ncbi:hypothetical protein [Mycobacterium sp.]|uniref:hypothetical protein n=1 Tax=Mycobacterium sp. TaxID=1785 RepID=UPI003F946404
MARDIDPAEARFRLPGAYAALLSQQRKAIISIDLRKLDWGLCDPAAVAADRAALEAEVRARPQKSVLLSRLLDGQPVTVARCMLTLPKDSPEWLSDSRTVRVWPDDLLESSDGPEDQHATMMGSPTA